VKKTILAVTAAAFLAMGAVTPSAAQSTTQGFVPLPLLPFMAALESKRDPNFKAVNPYEKKVAVKKKKKKKKARA
jgi:hypothetical protein